MPSKSIMWVALVFPVALWLLAPLLSIYPEWLLAKIYADCAVVKSDGKAGVQRIPEGERCGALMARRGQSGDVYGSVGSLFTGLALFGVAYTLTAEFQHRRRVRKPIVVCGFSDKDVLSLGNATVGGGAKTASVAFDMDVRVLAETAINIVVDIHIIIGKERYRLDTLSVGVPLSNGSSAAVKVSCAFDSKAMRTFIGEFPTTPKMALHFQASCQNLDGASFSTSVQYALRQQYATQVAKVLWFGSEESENVEAWLDNTPVTYSLSVEPGTWDFREG